MKQKQFRTIFMCLFMIMLTMCGFMVGFSVNESIVLPKVNLDFFVKANKVV